MNAAPFLLAPRNTNTTKPLETNQSNARKVSKLKPLSKFKSANNRGQQDGTRVLGRQLGSLICELKRVGFHVEATIPHSVLEKPNIMIA